MSSITQDRPLLRHIDNTGPVPVVTKSDKRAFGLRRRVTLFFSIAGLILSIALAATTYTVSRTYLFNQRKDSALSLAESNADRVRTKMKENGFDSGKAIGSVRTDLLGSALLIYRNREFASAGAVGFNRRDLPPELLAEVVTVDNNVQGTGRARQIVTIDDVTYVVVGVNIAEIQAAYFETFPVSSENNALRIIASTLIVGAAVTTLFSAAIGWWASRRLLRPLSRVADAAGNLASGGLDTRLPPDPDPDLDRLASSFNDMADAVQARIQREARFSSDVSHELRSPITALTAAVEVLDARRADLPDRSQQALDVVVNQVRRFDQMVLDLLELSRLDAGVGDLHVEEISVPDLVGRIARRYGFDEVPISVGPGGGRPVSIDKRRFERIIANLLDNARNHGGGPTQIAIDSTIADGERYVTVAVEDEGPGVAMSERTRIFERFARGTASRHRIGTGLGLALVSEHAESHGGSAWVEDRRGGGSRFVVSLPETPK
jgi:two-component system, OmpR family, sensor histidine kinase MtrB